MTKSLILPYKDTRPSIGEQVFIAPNAAVIGQVELGDRASIWFGVTVRGDVNYIKIGPETNIQDNTCVHVTRKTQPTIIGKGVTIGHSVTLHGCTLQDHCFIGMKACIMDGAIVETEAMVGAGALVTPGKVVKSGELWTGSPASYRRELSEDERAFIYTSRDNYVRLAAEYL